MQRRGTVATSTAVLPSLGPVPKRNRAVRNSRWRVSSSQRANPEAEVLLVADNTGRELVPDLLLIDHLIRVHRVRSVVLHVKPIPYYVSDATMADVITCLRWLMRASGQLGSAARRLWTAMTIGRLQVQTHWFYSAPLEYHEMPEDLAEQSGTATVTLMKGDLNYRRLVGDRHWPAATTCSRRAVV